MIYMKGKMNDRERKESTEKGGLKNSIQINFHKDWGLEQIGRINSPPSHLEYFVEKNSTTKIAKNKQKTKKLGSLCWWTKKKHF